jgi:hypothetical protein
MDLDIFRAVDFMVDVLLGEKAVNAKEFAFCKTKGFDFLMMEAAEELLSLV